MVGKGLESMKTFLYCVLNATICAVFWFAFQLVIGVAVLQQSVAAVIGKFGLLEKAVYPIIVSAVVISACVNQKQEVNCGEVNCGHP